MTIKPLVNFLKVRRADVRDISMQEEILNHVKIGLNFVRFRRNH